MRGDFIVESSPNESRSQLNGFVIALCESQTRNMIMTKGFLRRLNAAFEADDLKRHTGCKEGRKRKEFRTTVELLTMESGYMYYVPKSTVE